ncbi:MAG: YraN family protein [Christensenellales bacterium]|nr:YraN family protein [Christensenellales bacterium]
MNKKETGAAGEQIAARALSRSGLKILERNVRRNTGEIDIIAREKKTYVFVEVKTRSCERYGRPAEAVDHRKQQRILRTAALWLSEKGLSDAPVRFDIVEILPDETRHLKNAFDASSLY